MSPNQLIHQVSSESVHHILRYRAMYRFIPITKTVKNHLKNYWIRIFTKVESILPCYIPKLPTKFHLNPSTTFWDILLYVVFGHISLPMVNNHLKILRSRSGFGSSPKSNHFVLVTYPSSPQNLVQIRPQLFEIFVHKQIDRNENITSVHLRWRR